MLNELQPDVFISYSLQSKDFENAIRKLSDSITKAGLTTELDQYHINFDEGLEKWMIQMIHNSKYVLVVCSKRYYNSFMGINKSPKEVPFESALILNELYKRFLVNCTVKVKWARKKFLEKGTKRLFLE